MGRTLAPMSLIALFGLLAACNRPGSDELRRRVEDELRSARVNEPIDVSVAERIVLLRGAVPSAGEKQHIEDVVRSVPGVLAVDDRLLVQQPPSLTAATPDAEEAAAIAAALAAAGLRGMHVDVHGRAIRIAGALPRARAAEAMRIVHDAAPRASIEDQTTLE